MTLARMHDLQAHNIQIMAIAPCIPPATKAAFSVTCKDVVMGRGSGTQNHCGNVAYRKLVYLNKELYATSSKFEKQKIAKAIVAAVRYFGGGFLQADEQRGGLFFDIGDKRAWDKTSQALREGQTEVRQQLAQEDPAGMVKISEYKKVISEQAFFAYAVKIMESLFYSAGGESGIMACGPSCPYAKRRSTLNQLSVDPRQIYDMMLNMGPDNNQQQVHLNQGYQRGYILSSTSSEYEPLPYKNTPPVPPLFESMNPSQIPSDPTFEPLPYEMDGTNRTAASRVFSITNVLSQEWEGLGSGDLMDILNDEVEDLIRRKSVGLIKIDTKDAFEDLMFDDDYEDVFENEEELLAQDNKMDFNASMGAHSLMNMSLMTLDTRVETSSDESKQRPSISTPSDESKQRPSILVKREPSVPVHIRCRSSRVSFLGKSLMAIDNHSFSQLVETYSDQDDDFDIGDSDRSRLSVSRKMGFPIRKSVVRDEFKELAGQVNNPLGAIDSSVSNLSLGMSMASIGDLDIDDDGTTVTGKMHAV